MGANTISRFQKCGDILINKKTMRNKTKIYSFHCAFCSVDCDQLKKFTKHLEEHHMLISEDIEQEDVEEALNVPTVLLESEDMKVDVDVISCDNKTFVNTNMCSDNFADPLDSNILPNTDDYEHEKQVEKIKNYNYDNEDGEEDKDKSDNTDKDLEGFYKNIEESLEANESSSEDSNASKDTTFSVSTCVVV